MVKYFGFLSVFFLALGNTYGQEMPLPKFYSTKNQIREHNSCFLPIYQFKENDKVASIGAFLGLREVMYTMETPKVFFYLEDIEPRSLKPNFVQGFVFQCQEIYEEKTKSEFRLFIGDSISTKLPPILFDKILIENSLHEFTCPNEMLTDILSKLSNNGDLFISEKISTKPNR
jgi:hypothetical protein